MPPAIRRSDDLQAAGSQLSQECRVSADIDDKGVHGIKADDGSATELRSLVASITTMNWPAIAVPISAINVWGIVNPASSQPMKAMSASISRRSANHWPDGGLPVGEEQRTEADHVRLRPAPTSSIRGASKTRWLSVGHPESTGHLNGHLGDDRPRVEQ